MPCASRRESLVLSPDHPPPIQAACRSLSSLTPAMAMVMMLLSVQYTIWVDLYLIYMLNTYIRHHLRCQRKKWESGRTWNSEMAEALLQTEWAWDPLDNSRCCCLTNMHKFLAHSLRIKTSHDTLANFNLPVQLLSNPHSNHSSLVQCCCRSPHPYLPNLPILLLAQCTKLCPHSIQKVLILLEPREAERQQHEATTRPPAVSPTPACPTGSLQRRRPMPHCSAEYLGAIDGHSDCGTGSKIIIISSCISVHDSCRFKDAQFLEVLCQAAVWATRCQSLHGVSWIQLLLQSETLQGGIVGPCLCPTVYWKPKAGGGLGFTSSSATS